MIYIRCNDPDAPRSGEWAHLFGIQYNDEMKDIWIVEFPDGATDAWPSWNHLAQYDVKVQIEQPEPVEEPQHDDQGNDASPDAWDAARRIILAQGSAQHQGG